MPSEELKNGQPPVEPDAPIAEPDAPILKIEHLKKYFPIKTNFFGKPIRFLKAVDDISFELKKGKTIGVVGESGCGKTTLGRTILKLYESDGGKIYFLGDDITDLKKRQMMKYRTDIQLIFQDPYSSLPPRMTVGAIIAEAVRVHKIVPKSEVHGYVLDIMKKCGLKPSYYDRYPHEFSGGQRQRICIARALAVKPKLVICDEPVSALDVSIQAQIINLLKDLQKSIGLTYVFISHDLSVVKYITDDILVMYLGNAMEMSETEELFDNPLHPYTQALFSAVPAPNPRVKMNRIMLEGDIPSPANPPAGCKFHTRCSKCMKVCKFMQPEYTEVKPGHYVACHLYNEEIMNDLERYDAEFDRIEEEKRLAAELAAQKKRGKKPAPADSEQAPAAPDEVKEQKEEETPEAIEEKTETPVTEVTEEKAETPVTEVTEEKAETPAPEAVEEKTEAPASETTEEKTETPAPEATEEKAEAPAPEAVEEKAEEPIEQKPAAKKQTTAKKPAAGSAATKASATKSSTAKASTAKAATAKSSTAKASTAKAATTKASAAKTSAAKTAKKPAAKPGDRK